jgi:hypothetical protein
LAGITATGKLLLVTVDGQASFEESVRLMRSLAATDAVNLDGGGFGGKPAPKVLTLFRLPVCAPRLNARVRQIKRLTRMNSQLIRKIPLDLAVFARFV